MSSDGALQLVTALLCLVSAPCKLVTALLCLVTALSSW